MKQTEKKRILIVEDDAHIAEGLKLNLSLQGYETTIAGSGTEGLRMWKEWNPDLIVLDIMLPGLDGLSVLRHIRLEDERLPVLILSAKGAPDDRIKGFSYGVDDYLAKPFNLEEFLLRVERLLTRISWSQTPSPAGRRRSAEEKKYTFGGNTIDFTTMTAECRQGTIQLTEQEMQAPADLHRQPGETPVTKDPAGGRMGLLRRDDDPDGGQFRRPPEKIFRGRSAESRLLPEPPLRRYLFDHP